MNTLDDLDHFFAFIKEFFVETEALMDKTESTYDHCEDFGRVEKLIVYPIKSCAGFEVPDGLQWPLCPSGLQYDRQWSLIDEEGVSLSAKIVCSSHPFSTLSSLVEGSF